MKTEAISMKCTILSIHEQKTKNPKTQTKDNIFCIISVQFTAHLITRINLMAHDNNNKSPEYKTLF